MPVGQSLEAGPAEDCPFCEGHEAKTPPETYAVGPAGREPDTPGWTVRVVPNLFPALVDPAPAPSGGSPPLVARPARGRQEVVIHSPRHVASIAELTPGELGAVAGAWSARAAAAEEAGLGYVQALVNEGAGAGASRAHSHSQLVWLPAAPPEVERELGRAGACALCELLAAERRAGERLLADGELLVGCRWAGRAPYELLVAPVRCEPDAFTSSLLTDALAAAAHWLGRVRAVAGGAPANLWLHTAPPGHGGHWHLELLPRLTVFAGLELGAGLYVNPLAPEAAAAELRAVSPG
jgi:UDPglucose--hexose-1-phosphate uridylyltransferase